MAKGEEEEGEEGEGEAEEEVDASVPAVGGGGGGGGGLSGLGTLRASAGDGDSDSDSEFAFDVEPSPADASGVQPEEQQTDHHHALPSLTQPSTAVRSATGTQGAAPGDADVDWFFEEDGVALADDRRRVEAFLAGETAAAPHVTPLSAQHALHAAGTFSRHGSAGNPAVAAPPADLSPAMPKPQSQRARGGNSRLIRRLSHSLAPHAPDSVLAPAFEGALTLLGLLGRLGEAEGVPDTVAGWSAAVQGRRVTLRRVVPTRVTAATAAIDVHCGAVLTVAPMHAATVADAWGRRRERRGAVLALRASLIAEGGGTMSVGTDALRSAVRVVREASGEEGEREEGEEASALRLADRVGAACSAAAATCIVCTGDCNPRVSARLAERHGVVVVPHCDLGQVQQCAQLMAAAAAGPGAREGAEEWGGGDAGAEPWGDVPSPSDTLLPLLARSAARLVSRLEGPPGGRHLRVTLLSPPPAAPLALSISAPTPALAGAIEEACMQHARRLLRVVRGGRVLPPGWPALLGQALREGAGSRPVPRLSQALRPPSPAALHAVVAAVADAVDALALSQASSWRGAGGEEGADDPASVAAAVEGAVRAARAVAFAARILVPHAAPHLRLT